MAVSRNSGNKAGALVAINEMISPEMQASRYEALRTLPVVEYEKLDAYRQPAPECRSATGY